jgi:hypothetical protein
MTTRTAARAPVPRLSMWIAIVLFFALAIGAERSQAEHDNCAHLRPARCGSGGSSWNVLTGARVCDCPVRHGGIPLVRRERLPPSSLQRLEVTQHGRNKLRNGRMNVHRALQHRIGRFGVHNVEDAVDGLVTRES